MSEEARIARTEAERALNWLVAKCNRQEEALRQITAARKRMFYWDAGLDHDGCWDHEATADLLDAIDRASNGQEQDASAGKASEDK